MIWLSPSTLSRCKTKVAENHPDYVALKTQADAWLTVPGAYGPWWFSWGLMAVITGEVKYSQAAISLVQKIVDFGLPALTNAVPGVPWISQTSPAGYSIRDVIPAVAITLNWCGDLMTPAVKTQWVKQLTAWCDWVWGETNPARVNGYSLKNPADNFFWSAMTTWIGGLALGNSTDGNRHQELAKAKWNDLAIPYLNGNGAGGWFVEGKGYGSESRTRIMQILAAVNSMTGKDVINAPNFDWPYDTLLSILHETLPGNKFMAMCGEVTGDDRKGTINESVRAAARIAVNVLPAPYNQYAQHWLNNVGSANTSRWEHWIPMLWNRDDVVARDYMKELPTGYFAPGSGRMVSRSSWGDDAVVLTSQCGPLESSHQDRANGGFLLYAGSLDGGEPAALVTTTHYSVGSAHTLDGRLGSGNNALTVAGREQPELDPDLDAALKAAGLTKGTVLHHEDTVDYCYVVMEASGSYAARKWPGVDRPLSEWLRLLFFVKSATEPQMLVFDRCTKAQAGVECASYVNTTAEAQDPNGGGWLEIKDAGRRADWESLLHLNEEVGATVDSWKLGDKEAVSSWFVRQDSNPSDPVDRFASTINISKNANFPIGSVENLVPTEEMGKTAECGCAIGHEAVIVAPHLFPFVMKTDAARFFVTGLVPWKAYRVADEKRAATAIASPAGVATFLVPGYETVRPVTLSVETSTGPPTLASISLAPKTCEAGAEVALTATLTAPPVGITFSIALKSSSSLLPVPLFVTVPPGSTMATITFSAGSPTTDTLVTVTAIANGITKTDTILVKAKVINPPVVQIAGTIANSEVGAPSPVTGHKYTLVGDDHCWKVTLTDVKGGNS